MANDTQDINPQFLNLFTQNATLLQKVTNIESFFSELKTELKASNEALKLHEKEHEIYALKADLKIVERKLEAVEKDIDLLKQKPKNNIFNFVTDFWKVLKNGFFLLLAGGIIGAGILLFKLIFPAVGG